MSSNRLSTGDRLQDASSTAPDSAAHADKLVLGERSAMNHGNEVAACQVPTTMGRMVSSDRGKAILATMMALGASGAISACKDPVQTRYEPSDAAKSRGLAAIERAGCGSCHEIPGLDWPKGRLGPSLKGFDDVGLIAGELPNEPEVLAAFIRNAPAIKPGSTMPPMPVTETEAQDIASYLYGIDGD